MPKPNAVRSVAQELVYEKWTELGSKDWTMVEKDQKRVFKTYLDTKEYGRISYFVSADGVNNIWIKLVQRNRGKTDTVLLNVPLNWFPDGWVDEIKEMLVCCLFTAPEVIGVDKTATTAVS